MMISAIYQFRSRHITVQYQLIVILVTTFSILFYPQTVGASTQGVTGATSTGTSDIRVVVDELALIKGLTDISFGTWSGTGDLTGTDDICVATTGALFTTHNFQLRATGNGDAADPSAFTLSNGVNDIYYRVFLTDQDDTNELLPGQIRGGNQFFAGFTYFLSVINAGCLFPNSTITVIIEESQLTTGSGTHSGVLTLELIPE
ncbi:MAG: hypothetical protein R8G33_03865 [Gammaproteobacteria bacterium]|nr:hypothetical protein [Gammaproteobacteria bacterium]